MPRRFRLGPRPMRRASRSWRCRWRRRVWRPTKTDEEGEPSPKPRRRRRWRSQPASPSAALASWMPGRQPLPARHADPRAAAALAGHGSSQVAGGGQGVRCQARCAGFRPAHRRASSAKRWPCSAILTSRRCSDPRPRPRCRSSPSIPRPQRVGPGAEAHRPDRPPRRHGPRGPDRRLQDQSAPADRSRQGCGGLSLPAGRLSAGDCRDLQGQARPRRHPLDRNTVA